MLFSKVYQIDISKGVDWFDPILDYDTKLFIDPFLVEKSNHASFRNSHETIRNYFNNIFELAATTSRDKQSLKYKMLVRLNTYPEVKELCLGYASDSTKGSGSGSGFAESIVGAILDSIDRGIVSIPHFEELGIFNKGIGADRVSDITANLIKIDLIKYTQTICSHYKIPLQKYSIRVFNVKYNKWEYQVFDLPSNTYYSNQAVILIPLSFINDIPNINVNDFYDYCTNEYNENLRLELNTNILSNINKEKIIAIAKKHRKWVENYLHYKEQISNPRSYDIKNDPKGYYLWALYTNEYVSINPIKLIANDSASFFNSIRSLVEQFQSFIELNGGHKLLWNGNKSKSEEASQLLFYGIGKTYCKHNNIDITREAEMGRGPVDFKFSSGYKNRILLEVKLAKNAKFWHGLEKQFIYYLQASDVKEGFFMVICYNKKDFNKVEYIDNNIEVLNKKYGMNLAAIIIDASLEKPSASNIN
jgi:hypothetical protein